MVKEWSFHCLIQYIHIRESLLFMCQGGRFGGGHGKISLRLRGAEKNGVDVQSGAEKNYFFHLMNWMIRTVLKLPYNQYYTKISLVLSILGV